MRTEAQKLATKESRKLKREQRKCRRINKRKEKDKIYMSVALRYNRRSVSWGRRMSQGKEWVCDMGYASCEAAKYCNEDC